MLLTMQYQNNHGEESNEEIVVVDLEFDLITSLEEIENLRDINKKHTR